MDIFLYDSFKKEKQIFKSIKNKQVKFYVCGPTVYDNSHLGHARSAVVFDLLRRVLIANDYEVIMVKNFTDIDDKILIKMKEENINLYELTNKYIDSYKKDMLSLNILENTIEPKATENIEEMKTMINNLLKNKKAYISSDGIYMNSGQETENNISRLEKSLDKESESDFALWKFSEEEPNFNYIKKGRPGWHLECSAMIKKYLAYTDEPYQIDIHGGGIDLLFPHHHNEMIQTKEDSGQELSKYWIHNGFVKINGEKMSKSLGNSFFLKDILKEYHGEVIRFYFLNSHYRSDIDFNEIDLIASKKRLDRLYRLKKELINIYPEKIKESFLIDLFNTLNNDLNTNEALVIIENYLNKETKEQKKAILIYIENILGILSLNPYEYFQFGIKNKNEIEQLILERNIAKSNKNFELSDNIRNNLLNMGISLLDTTNGTFWEKKDKSTIDILNDTTP
jgi:cysteinyl-tRNA synthetase